jgi:hypothetical protein
VICSKKLKKRCSAGQHEELFFKYFPFHTLDFEKMCVDDIVCSSLGLNELIQATSTMMDHKTLNPKHQTSQFHWHDFNLAKSL